MATDLRHSRGTVLVGSTRSIVRAHLRSMLTAWGFAVIECSATEAALAAVARAEVQLALVDVELVSSEGQDLTSRFASARPGMRLVLLNPEDGDVELSKDSASRVVGTVGRPLSPRKMDRVVTAVFGPL